jgi:hypothetical protein
MPWAALIPAAIGGIGSLLGGALGSSAASGASAAQIAAAKQAEALITSLLGQYNPPIGAAAQQAADLSTGAGAGAVQQIQDTLGQNRFNVLSAADQANMRLDPYAALGGQAATQLAAGTGPGGDLTRAFNFSDIQNLDPGYQFRMDQASKALQASAAAKGAALGGGTLSSLMSLNQNMASAEAQNAFSRLTQQQQQRFNMLNSLVGTGYQAAGQQAGNITGANQFLASQGLTGAQNIGQWMIQPAQFAGTALTGGAETQAANAMSAGSSIANLMAGAGNAQASGIMGSANAWSNALGGLANAAGGVGKYYQDQTLLQQLGLSNPAVIPH